MPGTIVFKPVEANLIHNTDLVGRMNPYCAVTVGSTRLFGAVCKRGGKHPHWADSISLPVYGGEYQAVIEVLDKDKVTRDDNIGSCTINLQELQSQGSVNRWYPLYHNNKKAGDILLQASFQEGNFGSEALGTGLNTSNLSNLSGSQQYQQGYSSQYQQGLSGQQYQQGYMSQQGLAQPFGQTLVSERDLLSQKRTYADTVITSKGLYNQQSTGFSQLSTSGTQFNTSVNQFNTPINQFTTSGINSNLQANNRVYTEQHQIVQPHAFIKQVPVTEIVQVQKQVQVYEPVTMVRDVQYTELVPVTRSVEVMMPKVVMKEVEVMEPRIVDRQIEVIEYVPVKKMVEVIEMKTTQKTVESLEPESVHTTVEVTEQVPVRKTVTVTEPRTYQKYVEFVEPVVRTDIITKEVREPVIINETITKEVGPATVVGIEQRETLVQSKLVNQFNTLEITEEQRVLQERPYLGNREFMTHSNTDLMQKNKGLLSRIEERFDESAISGSGAGVSDRKLKKY